MASVGCLGRSGRQPVANPARNRNPSSPTPYAGLATEDPGRHLLPHLRQRKHSTGVGFGAYWRRCSPATKQVPQSSNRQGPIHPDDWDDTQDAPSHHEQQVFSFLTPEGIFQIRSSKTSGHQRPMRRPKVSGPELPSVDEQGLCIAATFSLAATNGRDLSRRVIWEGYARSTEHLVEAVEDTVLWRGGLIAVQETKTVATFTEVLTMSVVLPFLWSGAPCELDTLKYAITEGGGIVETVRKQWHMM